MIVRVENTLCVQRENCFPCGMLDYPLNPDTFAFEGVEFLGWVCSNCQELPAKALQEKLLETADHYRKNAAVLESLASRPIQVAPRAQLDAMTRQRFANEVEDLLSSLELPS